MPMRHVDPMASAPLEGGECVARIPGEAGIWVLILGEMSVFGLLFATFLFYRSKAAAQFAASQALLDRNIGMANTLLLLTSSWFVAGAIQALRRDLTTIGRGCLAAAFACGAVFVSLKAIEYSEKFSAGITIAGDDFFMYYFVLTGIHLLHVLIGLGVLAFAAMISVRGVANTGRMRVIEGGAAFWHMVDLLWIVLFPLLYFLR